MPSSYAHYTFGNKVLEKLPTNIQDLIKENKNAYNMGLNGPDLLFYYKPLGSNHINKLGSKMHQETAYNFFKTARHLIQNKNDDCLKSYVLGFICHFILDSQCHNYIEEKIASSTVSHIEIESEFDTLLMKENNIDQMSYNPTEHLIPDKKLASSIACLFPSATTKDLYKCQKSIKLYTQLLVCPYPLKRNIIITFLKLSKNYESLGGFIMKEIPNSNCEDSNIILHNLYNKAISDAVLIVTDYYNGIYTNSKLNNRFNCNYE